VDCEWAYEFVCEIDGERADEMFSMSDVTEVFVCCCKNEKQICHDESMKFILMSGEGQSPDQRLFEAGKPKGQVIDETKRGIGEGRFANNKLFGRQKPLQQLFEMLIDNEKGVRVVELFGEPGSGKTILAQMCINYAYERGFYKEHADGKNSVIYENFKRQKSFTIFEYQLRAGYASQEHLLQSIRSKRMVFILDNCDAHLENSFDKFVSLVRNVVAETFYVKFVIITLQKKELGLKEHYLELKPLSEVDAFNMLNFYAQEKLAAPNVQAHLEQLFQLMPRMPKLLWEVIQSLNGGEGFLQILRRL